MFKLARYLKFFKKEVIIGPIFKLTEAVFELIVPLVMAAIIDVGVKNSDTAYIFKMGGVLLLLGFVGLCCALVCQYFAAKASQGVGTMLRNDLFRHICSLSHAEIDKFGTPSLITRLTSDVNQLQLSVAMLIRLVIRAPFLAMGAIVMAMILDLKLSLIFLLATPLIVAVLYFIMSRSVPYFKTIQKKLDKVSLITRENLDGARVIRAFSKQNHENIRFENAAEDLTKTAVSVGKLSALLNPLTYVIMNLAIVAIVWFGGIRVDAGILTQGEIIAFVNYMTQILLALIVVANLVVIFTKAAACAARVNEVFETKPSVNENNGAQFNTSKDTDTPKIEFKNVSFSYSQTAEETLSDISFKVQRGQTVGVIGGTGSGKSTLVSLLPRLYDTVKGEILIDGVNVKDYPFKTLHSKIGTVPQNAALISGTIADNLRWGNENATVDDMKRAAKTAQALEFIEKLPNGFDSPVLQAGKNLSGGQKQRLTIARALTGSPEILILDDSASALDFATDAALRRAIKRDTKDMTVIIVSQRVGTIKSADMIVVLDDGRIAGIGTHDKLFNECEVYREICLSQLSENEIKSANMQKGASDK